MNFEMDRRLFLKSGAVLPLLSFLGTSQEVQASSAKGKIAIIGGGAGGITVAARLARKLNNPDITIIEPSEKHVYQAGQTLVGGGIIKKEKLVAKTTDYIPNGAKWVKDYAEDIDEEKRVITTKGGTKISYDYLVIATGLEYNYEKVEGLKRSDIGKNGVHSIYDFKGSEKAWQGIQEFVKKGGKGVFANADTPIKCGGAPKKIMYLTEDYSRLQNRREAVDIELIDSRGKLFGVKEFEEAIKGQFQARGIKHQLSQNLVKIDQEKKIATFKTIKEEKGEWDPDLEEYDTVRKEVFQNVEYDFIHVPPPMQAPKVIKDSDFSWKKGGLSALGFVQVDKHTLQHPKHKNVFCLGDVAGTPMGKTGGTVRKQAPILVENLVAVMEGREPTQKFGGYTVCPIITSYGTVMLAEFDYSGKPTPMLPFLDPTEERWIWWLLKVYMLEPMYFHGILRGLA